jgi:L-threonylcarbamoyladenylate synthase
VSAGESGVCVALDADGAERFAQCIAAGGVVVFPADTVYGLACDPLQSHAVQRLYELKGRPPAKPAAVMFFALEHALHTLPELGPRTGVALKSLLPGPLTVLLENPRGRYPLACAAAGGDTGTLGLRVPSLSPQLAALARIERPVLQSSANLAGGPEARTLQEVAPTLRASADLALDAGQLPGVASTVLDLREYERRYHWRVLRAGPISESELAQALDEPACGETAC